MQLTNENKSGSEIQSTGKLGVHGALFAVFGPGGLESTRKAAGKGNPECDDRRCEVLLESASELIHQV